MGPLDDDSLDVVLEEHVAVLARRLPRPPLLLLDPRRPLLRRRNRGLLLQKSVTIYQWVMRIVSILARWPLTDCQEKPSVTMSALLRERQQRLALDVTTDLWI